jgi:hypothetical protein
MPDMASGGSSAWTPDTARTATRSRGLVRYQKTDRRRASEPDLLPPVCGLFRLLNPPRVVAGEREARCAIDILPGVAERREDLLGAIGEDRGRLLQRIPGGQACGGSDRHEGGEPQHDRRGDRERRRHGCRFALGGRHEHVGRRRFAGGERGGERIAARQRRGHGQRRSGPSLRILFQTPENEALDRRVEVVYDRRWCRQRPALVPSHQVRQRLRLDGAASGEDLEEDETERVEIAFDRGRLSRQLLGRHVLRRAGEHRRRVARADREAEVGEAHIALAVDHHVGRLQIAMQHAALVRGREPRAQLPRDLDRLVLRDAADSAEQRCEIFAVHILHREEAPAVGVAEIVQTADVLVRHLAREAQLLMEPREAVGVRCHAFGKKLQRDRMIERQVVGAIHLAHAAAAEERDQSIASGDDRSGREAI